MFIYSTVVYNDLFFKKNWRTGLEQFVPMIIAFLSSCLIAKFTTSSIEVIKYFNGSIQYVYNEKRLYSDTVNLNLVCYLQFAHPQ